MTRLFAIATIELKRVLRDRPSLSLLLLLPAVQIILFGYAIRIEPESLPVAVLGHGDRIEAIARELATDPAIRLQRRADTSDAEAALRDGAAVAVSMPLPGSPRIEADGADPIAARTALGIVRDHLWRIAAGPATSGKPDVDVHWAFNPHQRSAWVLVPGLGGAIVMIAMLMLAAQSIVREREEGGWEALLLSPVSGLELLLGKMVPYLLLALVQEWVVLLLGSSLFGIAIVPGTFALLLLTVPFAAAHLSWGFVLSLLANTRLQAMQGAMFLYLPSMLLSGFLFPFAAMPGWARAIGEALPLTHFIRASRDLLLRDADSNIAWHAWPPMLLCAASGLVIALLLWRREAQ